MPENTENPHGPQNAPQSPVGRLVFVSDTTPLAFTGLTAPPHRVDSATATIRLGGDTLKDTYVILHDRLTGPDADTGSRGFEIVAREPTGKNGEIVGHVSIYLHGSFWNGTQAVPAIVELENKVNEKTGLPEFWIELPIGTPAFKLTCEQVNKEYSLRAAGGPGTTFNFYGPDGAAKDHLAARINAGQFEVPDFFSVYSSGTMGANIKLTDRAETLHPSQFIRSFQGSFQVLNNAVEVTLEISGDGTLRLPKMSGAGDRFLKIRADGQVFASPG